MNDLRIAVVGGSIAGPLVAALLQRRAGIDVKIFEQARPRFGQGGGVIFLDLTTLEVMDDLGVDRASLVDFDGEFDVTEVRVRDRQEVMRRTLVFPRESAQYQRIHEAIESRLRPGTTCVGDRVVGIDASRHGSAELRFANGDRAWADIVIFTDGRASTGRRLLQPNRELAYDGWVIHRGINPAPPPEDGHFVRYIPEVGLFNTYAVRSGLRTRTYWEFDVNTTMDEFIEEFGDAPERRPFLHPGQVSKLSQARTWVRAGDLLPNDIAAFAYPDVSAERMAAPMFTIADPTQAVHLVGNGYAVLLGDALAPMFPMTGRGANNAVEEAARLAGAVNEVVHHGADLEAALRGWEERLLPAITHDLAFGVERARKLHLGEEVVIAS